MRNPRYRLVAPTLLGVLLLASATATTAQGVRWPGGAWKGDQWLEGEREDATVVVVRFTVAANSIAWELEIVGPAEGRGNRAKGTAKVTGNSLTLEGEYYEGSAKGSKLRYALEKQRDDDELSGVGIGRGQTTFKVLWKRVK